MKKTGAKAETPWVSIEVEVTCGTCGDLWRRCSRDRETTVKPLLVTENK